MISFKKNNDFLQLFWIAGTYTVMLISVVISVSFNEALLELDICGNLKKST